jgi:ABC-type transporter Mla subunit MlaD
MDSSLPSIHNIDGLRHYIDEIRETINETIRKLNEYSRKTHRHARDMDDQTRMMQDALSETLGTITLSDRLIDTLSQSHQAMSDVNDALAHPPPTPRARSGSGTSGQ